MSRILFVDTIALGLDLSWQAQAAGHTVRHFINDPRYEQVGQGMVPLVREWEKHVDWADYVILLDNKKYLQRADQLRAQGAKIIGATEESFQLEQNRELGMKVFKKHNIPVIPYKTFEDYDNAINYVKKYPARYVSKPDDDKGVKALSYVSKDAGDLIYMLERWKRNDKLHGRFTLQEFKEGIEFGVGAWLTPWGFASGYCENFEFKKLMPGDMGPNTGEMGTVLRYVKKSKLAAKVLKPLEDYLMSTGHTGYVDVNCIIDEQGTPWPLEFTMRLGYPTVNIQMELHKDISGYLCQLSEGYKYDDCIYNAVSIGAYLCIPDFPYSKITRREVTDIPIYGLDRKSLLEHVHPCEMKMTDNLPFDSNGKIERRRMFATAGDEVMIVTAVAPTVQRARAILDRRMDKISIPNSPFYRNDIGKSLATTLPKLQAMGYALGMTYADS